MKSNWPTHLADGVFFPCVVGDTRKHRKDRRRHERRAATSSWRKSLDQLGRELARVRFAKTFLNRKGPKRLLCERAEVTQSAESAEPTRGESEQPGESDPTRSDQGTARRLPAPNA